MELLEKGEGGHLLVGMVQEAAEWAESGYCKYKNAIVSINKIESIDIK